MAKYIFVVGGVYSGCGKGISCASLAFLLKQRGHSVQCIKFDPYLNVNAGILSPREHGENFVTEDGTECDLDLGSYERIAGIDVSNKNICTSGILYKELIEEQDDGKYLGQTVQIIPHLTNKIQEKLVDIGKEVDLVVVEIGGVVSDIESAAFYEAIRQFKQKNPNETMLILVSPILWVEPIQENKTKPLQNSVKALQSYGIQPDIILCRTWKEVPDKILKKIANLTNVPEECVIDAPDVSSIYQVPIEFFSRHIDDIIADKLHLKRNGCRIHKYRDLVEKYVNNNGMQIIDISILGKYENYGEAYLSLKEAVYHAAVANNVKVKINWLSAADVDKSEDLDKLFTNSLGLIVPGGFDSKFINGKLKGIKFARENKMPFLGICLGLQCAVIEFARSICKLADANSTEFDKKTTNPVVYFIEGQESQRKKISTMRLGAYDCELDKDSIAFSTYKKKLISERHRHRYEVNASYTEQYEKLGLKVTGKNPESGLIEIMELDSKLHPFFVGTQAHPEFKSKLTSASPLFVGLIEAAIKYGNK